MDQFLLFRLEVSFIWESLIRQRQVRLHVHVARLPAEDPAQESFLSRSEGLVHAEGAPKHFIVASGGVLSEGYGHDVPGVCLGDGQTEAYLKDTGMTCLVSAWAMARRRPI